MGTIIGIDLGTTNSLAAVFLDGEARLIANAHGSYLTPSVVSLAENGDVLVGEAARHRMITAADQSAAFFKRYMGTPNDLRLGGRVFRPEELSSLVLRSLKQDAEAELGEPISDAVITVPAYFRDAQRKATRRAAQLAGLNVVRLINEPTAAALAYGVQEAEQDQQLLIFDLGGGTFDVSVLHFFEGIMEVRSSAGDSRLGGEDFVDAIIRQIAREAQFNFDVLPVVERNRIRKVVEIAKRRLSEEQHVAIEIEAGGRAIQRDLSREEFRSICAPLLERMQTPIERALRDARILTKELDELILVGGATRMPLVRELVAKLFGRFPSHHVPPDEAVALGAAVQAGLKVKAAALRERVLTDVAPFSLGIEVVEIFDSKRMHSGLFKPMLERNTIIPASRSDIFCTVGDNQTEIHVKIYQGESRYVKDNVLLGNLEVHVPSAAAGQEQIEVRFTYDVDGLLEVEAKPLGGGALRRAVFHESNEEMDEKEMKRRLDALSALKIHPREQAQNTVVLERARRMYEESLGVTREEIGHLMLLLEQALATQNPAVIEQTRAQVGQRLGELDQENFW